MSDSAIHIRSVNKRFGNTHAVRDLDVEVPAGSLCGFLGPNGAGKSTTIRMIMSIIGPDSGTIEVFGRSALDHKDRIGYLPEERGLYRKMRVAEVLTYIAKLKGVRRPDLPAYIQSWLERIELADAAKKRCQELSKGMQQKVQFLAAIIHEPELLILDEPFSGLDPVNADLLRRLIDELHDAGRTIIFSTHVLHQAERLCDRILLINRGQKLLDATLDEIQGRFDPRTLVVEPLETNGRAGLDPAAVDGVLEVGRLENGASELRLAPDVDPQRVMRDVLALGPIRSISLRQLTLEEVFVSLVTEDEGVAAAQRVREELRHP